MFWKYIQPISPPQPIPERPPYACDHGIAYKLSSRLVVVIVLIIINEWG